MTDKVSRHGQTWEEEPLFHNMVRTMELDAMGVKPRFVRCPICTLTQLSIRGAQIYRSPDPEERASLPEFAPGVVLICGHMVCKPCWGQLKWHHDTATGHIDSDGEVPPVRCPVCRTELAHPGCGCPIDAVEMPKHPRDPTASAEYREQWGGHHCYVDGWAANFPRTLNGGGEIAPQCEDCAHD